MSSSSTGFQSLPLDLLIDSILVLLPIKDLLALSSTCKSFYSTIHQTESIWKSKVAKDFRFPTDATGRVTGFKTLYRKLRKPQVWVWGQDRNQRLGLGPGEREGLLQKVLQGFEDVPTPLRLRKAESIGMIDLQAGGWSFHGLDVDGGVWCWGTLDGLSGGWNQDLHRVCHANRSEPEPVRLAVKNFPKIKAISCGRSHAAAISDQGNVLEWHSWSRVAKLCSAPWDTMSQSGVLQICASWDFTALLSRDGSIYFWREPTNLEVKEALDSQFDGSPDNSRTDAVYELDSRDRIIQCPHLPDVENSEGLAKDYPIKIAAGEDFIICLTAMGKIYKLDVSSVVSEVDEAPFEEISADTRLHRYDLRLRENLRTAFLKHQRTWEYLPMFSDPCILKRRLIESLPEEKFQVSVQPKITHISAQYRTFVSYSVASPIGGQRNPKEESYVFFGNKETSKDDEPEVLPGLQQRGVIQVTLGDYHYAALLSNGQVLTWGEYSAGALGVGHSFNLHRKLRSVESNDDTATQNNEQPRPEEGTRVPMAVQSFTGTDHRISTRHSADQLPSDINLQMPPRYVFSVTAAGWHTGCLAFTLNEEEDHDYGLGVLEDPGKATPEVEHNGEPPSMYTMPVNRHNGPARFRIGFAGRFIRGGARGAITGGMLSHHGYRAVNQGGNVAHDGDNGAHNGDHGAHDAGNDAHDENDVANSNPEGN